MNNVLLVIAIILLGTVLAVVLEAGTGVGVNWQRAALTAVAFALIAVLVRSISPRRKK